MVQKNFWDQIFGSQATAFVASHYIEYPLTIPPLNAGRDWTQAKPVQSQNQNLAIHNFYNVDRILRHNVYIDIWSDGLNSGPNTCFLWSIAVIKSLAHPWGWGFLCGPCGCAKVLNDLRYWWDIVKHRSVLICSPSLCIVSSLCSEYWLDYSLILLGLECHEVHT